MGGGQRLRSEAYRQMTSGFSEMGYFPTPIDIFERPLERMTGEMFE